MLLGKKLGNVTVTLAAAVEAETTDDAAARHHLPSAIEPAARVPAESGRDETTAHQEGDVKEAPTLHRSAAIALQTAGSRDLHENMVTLVTLQSRFKAAAADQGMIH
ncbi:hypothetical protein MY11210_001448 [Beauveria gryllotalpidicola]